MRPSIFRALAHTVDTMRILYSFDDRFHSYTESTKLTSVEYERYLHEQGKPQNNANARSYRIDVCITCNGKLQQRTILLRLRAMRRVAFRVSTTSCAHSTIA